MDYLLTEEQIMIRDLARQIAEEKIVPVRAELDEHNKFPVEIMKAMAQADLFGIYIPEDYGGLDPDGAGRSGPRRENQGEQPFALRSVRRRPHLGIRTRTMVNP